MRTGMWMVLVALVAVGCGPPKEKETNDPKGNPKNPPEIMIEIPDDPAPMPMGEDPSKKPVDPAPMPAPAEDPAKKPVELTPPGQGPVEDPAKKPGEPAPIDPAKPEVPPPGTASVDELLPKLGDPAARDATLASIKAHGAAAVEPLVTALGSAQAETKANAVLALGALGKEAAKALPELRKLAETGEPEDLRIAAKFAIDAIEGK